jgi:hypothetical protein
MVAREEGTCIEIEMELSEKLLVNSFLGARPLATHEINLENLSFFPE